MQWRKRKRRRTGALFATVAAVLAASTGILRAADIYVDDSNPNPGTGTLANPFQTISAAITGRVAGDIIHVAGGTYAPFAINNISGAAGNPITIQVMAGQTATINGGMPTGNRDGIRITNSSYWVVDGFTLVGTGNPTTSRAGISSVQPLGSRLGNGAVNGNHTDIVIRNNTISNYGTWGVFTGYANNVTVQNNTISGSVEEHGVYLSNSSTGHHVVGNTVFNNFASGIQLNGDFDFPGGGIINNSIVERNRIFNNGTGGGGALNNEGVQDSIFRNNVLWNNHASGIVMWIGENGAPITASSNNNLIVNNTVLQAADGRAAMNIIDGYDNTIFNNIFFHQGPSFRDAVTIGTLLGGTPPNLGNDIDRNIYSINFEYGGVDRTLAQWRALLDADPGVVGGDDNSITITAAQMQAMFVDYLNGDLRLADVVGNPAINAGVASFDGFGAALFDFLNAARPQGGSFDIGAYEVVPEPASVVLAAVGMTALVLWRRRRPVE